MNSTEKHTAENGRGAVSDVLISISTLQSYEGCDPNRVELVTQGTLVDHGSKNYDLTYYDTLSGEIGTKNTFQITPKRVTLLRSGDIFSQMIFQEGLRHHSLYTTPQGDMDLGIAASSVYSTIDSAGGKLEIDYTIDINHMLTGQSSFRIDVRQAPHSPAQ